MVDYDKWHTFCQELKNCPLCFGASNEKFCDVPWFRLNPRLVIVGESPSLYRTNPGDCFGGQSRDVFAELLRTLDCKREDVYVTNLVKAVSADSRRLVKSSDHIIQNHCGSRDKLVRIQTRLGLLLETTVEHPIMTSTGWKQAALILPGDSLAVPLETRPSEEIEFDPELALIIGLYLGDGSLVKAPLTFTNQRMELVTVITTHLDKYGFPYHLFYSKAHRLRLRGRNNSVYNFFKRTSLLGSRSGTKFLPEEVMSWNRTSQLQLVNGLFSTDGTVNRTVGYTSKSLRLVQGVQQLLFQLGMISRLGSFTVRGNTYYHLVVTDSKSLQEFAKIDLVHSGKNQRAKTFAQVLSKRRSNDKVRHVPHEVVIKLLEALANKGITHYRLDAMKVASLPPMSKMLERKSGMRRETFKKICEYADVDFFSFLDETLIWDLVTSVSELSGNFPVVDYTVLPSESYIANGVLVHNCTIPHAYAGDPNNCVKFLEEELAMFGLTPVLLLGRQCVQSVLKKYVPLTAQEYMKNGRQYFILPHPMTIIYNPTFKSRYLNEIGSIKKFLNRPPSRLTDYLDQKVQ